MLNNDLRAPVSLYRAATDRAVAVVEAVTHDQLEWPTPCSEWSVRQLIDHLVGGADYLLAAATGPEGALSDRPPGITYRTCVDRVLTALESPGALERVCVSPLGFDWSVADAVAGTFMDVLIHTWDLARATGQDERLDADLVAACSAMFLPEMPRLGREAGIIGPEVLLGEGASAQDRLLAAMGRSV
ncbi:TIGR03086 family metal-binding protein [Mycobacterium sp. 1245805.9]|uniref:TIGR03086 family metal-binding protein n=1 Tax=Mycobacterium sp. 1245805.9 TaxID=1856862 RepID=UPI0008016AA4|nr:TIGR03086 family metal-binding protein [Mycobacterium sp. 1245805.9]OBI94261.1 TIGR03086 family protein [Mycobacterium sp. 1245805.9]